MIAAARRLPAVARYVRIAIRVDLQRRAQYRGSMWIWSLSSVLQICVGLAVWRVIAQTAGSVGGYDEHTVVGYFLVLLIVREATYSGIPWHLEDLVHEGALASKLVRPVHPMLESYAEASAFRVYSFAIVVPAAVALWFVFDASVAGGAIAMLVGACLLPFANIARMYLDTIIACLALWIPRIGGFRGAYYLVMLFLGGQFAPLDMLPDTAQVVAKALPFYWFLGFPVELAIGRQPLDEVWSGLGLLVAWGVALHLALKIVWKRGIRAHEAVGT